MKREMVAALLVVLALGAGASWLAWQFMAPDDLDASTIQRIRTIYREDIALLERVRPLPELINRASES